LTRVERIFCIVLLVNIVAAFGLGLVYGTSEFGKAVGGHYFLNNHGRYVEVSQLHWRISGAQDLSILPSFFLLMLVNERAVRRGKNR
jgi:hypothetical protein